MAHAIGMRATSLVASAALLGLAVIGALTMTIVQGEMHIPEGRPFDIEVVPPPAPDPPQSRQRQPQPLRPIEDDAAAPTDLLPPLETITEIGSTESWSDAPPTINNPHWVRRPRDLARYYPTRALARGVEGRVVLDCTVTTSGALRCDVMSETPRNWGFAEAALRISRDYQMVPAMRGETPIEARHRMVIPFELQ